MTNENQAITVQPASTTFLAPAASLEQLKDRYLMFNSFVQGVMRKDHDYLVIPGTDKPSLAKPGAEKLTTLFGLSSHFEQTTNVIDMTGETRGGEPFFLFAYKCSLYRGDLFIAECEGSCNSWEKKYRYRNADRVCPNCGKPSIIKGKEEYGGGWICFAKKGGCGAKFSANDPKITGQQVGQVQNAEIYDQINTLQKMAQKRAFIGAVLIATNASEYFTQDIEDMPGFVEGTFAEAPVQKPAPEPAKVRVDIPASSAPSVNQSNTTSPTTAPEPPATPTSGTPANGSGNGDKPAPAYSGSLALFGKHKYPAPWCSMLAAYKRANQYEVDGILQKLALPQETRPEQVVDHINQYLDAKAAAAA